MRRLNLIRAGVFGAALLLPQAILADDVPLAFGTRGGDAWDFYKSIDVTVPEGRCDHVAITSPASAVVLSPDRGHVRARIGRR